MIFHRMNPRALRSLQRHNPGAEVLVIRNMGLGDVLMVTPTLRECAQRYPALRFSYAVNPPYVGLFRGLPYLDRVLPVEEAERAGFRFVIDLREYCERAHDRNRNHRADVFANHFGLSPLPDRRPDVVPGNEHVASIEGRIAMLGRDPGKPLVALALRGLAHIRSIPQAAGRAFARLAIAAGFQVLVLDADASAGWKDLEVLNGCGQFTAAELPVVCGMADAVVASDTGLAHVAGTVETPLVAVFSSWDPDLRLRYYRKKEVIWHRNRCAAAPCQDLAPMPICGKLGCLSGVTGEEILAHVERAIRADDGTRRIVTVKPARRFEVTA